MEKNVYFFCSFCFIFSTFLFLPKLRKSRYNWPRFASQYNTDFNCFGFDTSQRGEGEAMAPQNYFEFGFDTPPFSFLKSREGLSPHSPLPSPGYAPTTLRPPRVRPYNQQPCNVVNCLITIISSNREKNSCEKIPLGSKFFREDLNRNVSLVCYEKISYYYDIFLKMQESLSQKRITKNSNFDNCNRSENIFDLLLGIFFLYFLLQGW